MNEKDCRKFTPAEFAIYALCVKESRERYPNLYPEDRAKNIREIYNQNIDPNMRTLEEIEDQSKLK